MRNRILFKEAELLGEIATLQIQADQCLGLIEGPLLQTVLDRTEDCQTADEAVEAAEAIVKFAKDGLDSSKKPTKAERDALANAEAEEAERVEERERARTDLDKAKEAQTYALGLLENALEMIAEKRTIVDRALTANGWSDYVNSGGDADTAPDHHSGLVEHSLKCEIERDDRPGHGIQSLMLDDTMRLVQGSPDRMRVDTNTGRMGAGW